MTAKDYQTPKLWILLLDSNDVITSSGWSDGGANSYDKGVEDFFVE